MSRQCTTFFRIIIPSIIMVLLDVGHAGRPDDLRHTFKLTNYTVLPGTRGISVENITFIHDEFKQYGSAVINIPEDITILSIRIRIFRCIQHNYRCESHQNWNLTYFCPFLTAKHQFYSIAIDSVYPRTWMKSCPTFRKGTYEIRNASMDIDALLRFLPDVSKYHWQLLITADTTKFKTVGAFGSGYVLPYVSKH